MEDTIDHAMLKQREEKEQAAVEYYEQMAQDYACEQEQSQPRPEDFNISYGDASHGC